MRKKILALAFDIDDTLIASTRSNLRARRRSTEALQQNLNLRADDVAADIERRLYAHFGWARMPDLWRALALELGAEQPADHVLEDAMLQFEETFFATLSVLPTVTATLSSLRERGVPLGIVSDGDSSLQQRKLRATGLSEFFAPDNVMISIQSDYCNAKPSTSNLRRLQQRLGIQPCEAAYVGDKPRDILAANTAGWLSVLSTQAGDGDKTDWPFPSLAVQRPDLEIRTFAEILELV